MSSLRTSLLPTYINFINFIGSVRFTSGVARRALGPCDQFQRLEALQAFGPCLLFANQA